MAATTSLIVRSPDCTRFWFDGRYHWHLWKPGPPFGLGHYVPCVLSASAAPTGSSLPDWAAFLIAAAILLVAFRLSPGFRRWFFKQKRAKVTYGRQPIPERVRHEVWRRDQGRCVKCGSQMRLEYDHIVPVSRGGSNTARNLQVLCETCNRRKGAKI